MRKVKLQGVNLKGRDLRNWVFDGAETLYADLEGCNLEYGSFAGASMNGTNMTGANLKGANFTDADLYGVSLKDADLTGAKFDRADMRCTDISGAAGLLDEIDYMEENFEAVKEGYIVYKAFGMMYDPPQRWDIRPGSVISERVNTDRARESGCGINVCTKEWAKRHAALAEEGWWMLLIPWKWLPGVVVPYNTTGEIRCSRAKIIGQVKEL